MVDVEMKAAEDAPRCVLLPLPRCLLALDTR